MDSEDIEQQAADWLVKRDSGHWTTEDETAFTAWKAQATTHRIAAIRLSQTWRQADRLQALGAGVARGTIPAPGQWNLPNTSRQRVEDRVGQSRINRSRLALAASVLIAIAIGLLGYRHYFSSPIYRTELGGLQTVPLKDGSTVTLNTASEIRLSIDDRKRHVELAQGEAFFEVAPDPERPFTVGAAGHTITALGTAFSVRRDDDRIQVVVTEGKVLLQNTEGKGLLLTAGALARTTPTGAHVQNEPLDAAEAQLSWRTGYIALHDTPLPQAIAEFNRYNTRKLRIADAQLDTLKVGGNLRATNVDAFVRVLERGFPIHAREQGDTITLQFDRREGGIPKPAASQ